jgi:parallel beta-helix repeat protein
MTYKTTALITGLLLCLLLAGCVTAIDQTLPYDDLPQLILAAEVRLVASPSHPTAELAADPIPAGTSVRIVGADSNAAWLLVLHDKTLGWMHTTFSRTNVGLLKAALVIDPLAERCTEYRTDATDLSEVWVSTESGATIVQGAIYRPDRLDQFANATLTLNVDGSGTVSAGDYIHAPLTPSSALILFTFAVADLAPESRLHFTLDGIGDEAVSFQAVLFSNSCPDEVSRLVSPYTSELPVGEEKLLSSTQAGPPIAEVEGTATPPAPPTPVPTSSGTTTSTAGADAPQGEILLDILSTRAGPGFDYPANGARLQGETFPILARVCSEPGGYDWYLIERQERNEQWLPGLEAFIRTANVESLICLPPPPAPAPNPSSVTVLVGIDAGAELLTDPAAFAPYLAVIGYYRLAEKAALALPNSPAVRQLPDYAHGRALTRVQDTIRQLRTQRASAELTIDQVEIKLVVTFSDGTAGVLAQEAQTTATQRLVAAGGETLTADTYRGPILYVMRYQGGRWTMRDVILLGQSGGLDIVATANTARSAPAVEDETIERLNDLLASKRLQAVPGSTQAHMIDASAFARPASTVIEGRITANTVLQPEGSPYLIQGEVTVDNGVTLLIEPGTIVKFNPDSFLNIDGALNARGDEDHPIIFTSSKDDLAGGDTNGDGSASTPAPGDWTMIRFRDASNDVNSIIEHAIIRYAGKYRGDGYGAIHLEAASPTIVNNVIEDSFSYAISGDVASFPLVGGNRLARNGGNGFLVRDGQMSNSGAWRTIVMPYTLLRPITIREGATLAIEPGVVVKFADDTYIDVYGAFKATGTVDDPVVFTSLKDDTAGGDTNGDGESTAPAPGDWTMIRFYDASNDANSLIDHTMIRYAGEHRGNRYGAIHLEAASPTITNNTIEESFGYAISGDVHSFPVISGNTIQRNAGNGFEVRPGTMTLSGVWRNTDIGYAVPGVVTVNDGATLSIEPGVIVKLGNDAYFDIYGAFRALGTAELPIYFTSLRDDALGGDTNGDQNSSAPAAGDWTMIRFRDSSNDTNASIEHSVIRYAGKHRGNPFGAIHLEAASPTIANSVIEDSFWFVISADIHSFPVVNGNELLRNGGNGLEIREGQMTISGVWRNTDIVYTLLRPMTINQSAMLSIEPGATVKFGDDAFFDIYGSFKAVGVAENPITFTSLKDDSAGGDTNGDQSATAPGAGDWTMIRFRDTSNDVNSIIEQATIRYAGEHRGNRFGAIQLEAASPTIADNIIADNLWYAISGDVHSFPTISGNQLARNIGNGFEIREGQMTVSGLWRNTDIVYAVLRPLTINQGAMLTIEPGVVLKFGDDSFIDVYGTFKTAGAIDQPIIFTSLRDDSIGGDTNADGSASSPSPGDWTMIRFYDASNDTNSAIESTVIRYAGEHRGNRYGAIHLIAASPTITNNTIEHSFAYGIWHDANSAPQLSDNTFHNNAEGDVVAAQ